jgi:O-antigen/teichoic acid export membrane protein
VSLAITNSGNVVSPVRGRVVRGASVLVIGSLAWQALGLIRAVVVARLLGPEQFGLASMLLLVATLVEMVSSLSLDQQLVQAPDGDSQTFVDASHLLAAIRGVCGAGLILLLAYPLAWLFGVPEYAWAFALLAGFPLFVGLSHLDRKRVQRDLRFGADMSVEFSAQVVSVSVAIILAWETRHFTAALWAIMAGALVTLIGSFVVAERPYRWSWHVATLRRLIRFGWPLLLSSLLLFAVMQGERSLLAAAPRLFPGSSYTARDLGLFAAAGTLAYAPVVVIGRLGSSMSLPLLSSAQHDAVLFTARYRRILTFLLFSAVTVALFYAAASSTLIKWLFGEPFAPATSLLMLLALAQAIRMVRMAPTVGSLALGDSANAMWANAGRATGILLTVVVLARGLPIVWIGIAAVGAEVFSLAVASSLFRSTRNRCLTDRRGTVSNGRACSLLYR